MKQKTYLPLITRLFSRTVFLFGTIYFSVLTISAQELSVDDMPGDWEVNATWDASGDWDVIGTVPTSGVNRWATIRGDIFISGSLDYSHTISFEGLTIDASDTLTIFGDLTFTGADMTLDVQGVLKVYGNLDTNGSDVLIFGDGVIVISGNLVVDGGSNYSDAVGGDDLYVDGTITGNTGGNGKDFDDGTTDDLESNHGTLYTEVQGELPVVLLNFDTEVHGELVRLNWATASEENFDFFDIQRSKDGTNYESIGQVEGNGNSTQLIKYSFSDIHPYMGTSYYRLKAVDYDGSFEIFESKRAEFSFGNSGILLYPNPVKQHASGLRVNFQDILSDKEVIIYDAQGKMVFKKNITQGINSWELNEELPRGLYHLKAQVGNQTLVKKFLVN